MSFTYRAGATTPNLAGLLEIGSIRISGVNDGTYDGTFELHRLGGVLDAGPPIRDSFAALSNDHGAFAGTPFYDPRVIVIEGQLSVPTLSDIWGAIDLLKQTFNLNSTALQTMTVNTSGWSAARQCDVRVTGAGVQIIEPDGLDKLVPDRLFTVTVEAPDPRMYATSVTTTTVASGGTSVTNNGTIGSPVTAWFDATSGALTAPLRLTAPDGGYIEYNVDIASGHWVKVNTRDGTAATTTAVDDTGANVYANVTKVSASLVAPGTATWTSSKAGGTGVIKAQLRDAWA